MKKQNNSSNASSIKIQKCKDMINNLRKEHFQNANKNKQLRKDNKRLVKILEKLHEQVKKLTRENEEKDQKIQDLLKQQIKEKQLKREELTQLNAQHKHEKQALSKDCNQQIQKEKSNSIELKNHIKNIQEENDKLIRENEEKDNKIVEFQNLLKQNKRQINSISQLNAQLEKEKQKLIQEHNLQIEKEKSNNIELVKKKQEFQVLIDPLKKDFLPKLKDEIIMRNVVIDKLKEKVIQMEDFKNANDELKKENDELNEEIGLLATQIRADIKEPKNHDDIILQNIFAIQKKVTQMIEEIDKMIDEFKKHEEENAFKDILIERLKQKIYQTESDNDN